MSDRIKKFPSCDNDMFLVRREIPDDMVVVGSAILCGLRHRNIPTTLYHINEMSLPDTIGKASISSQEDDENIDYCRNPCFSCLKLRPSLCLHRLSDGRRATWYEKYPKSHAPSPARKKLALSKTLRPKQGTGYWYQLCFGSGPTDIASWE